MALLEVKKLTLSFGGLMVIDALDFAVEEGAIVSLIGPNGAGKTSVFNCLTGFYRASGGEILFQGRSLIRRKPHTITRWGMARTFQNLRLFRDMSVLTTSCPACTAEPRPEHSGPCCGRRAAQGRGGDSAGQRGMPGFCRHLPLKHRLARNLPYGDQRRWNGPGPGHQTRLLLLDDRPPAELDEKQRLISLIRGYGRSWA
jgi:branched-chain amino acid transport system ATP-binding protein